MNSVYRDIQSKKLIIEDIESNVYYRQNAEMFLKLKELVDRFPRSFFKKIGAKGRRIEQRRGRLPALYDLKQWIMKCTSILDDESFNYNVLVIRSTSIYMKLISKFAMKCLKMRKI